jgi:hypothetical protein
LAASFIFVACASSAGIEALVDKAIALEHDRGQTKQVAEGSEESEESEESREEGCEKRKAGQIKSLPINCPDWELIFYVVVPQKLIPGQSEACASSLASRARSPE